MTREIKPQKTLIEKIDDSHYQPTKAEMEKPYDMLGLSEKQVRDIFFNPKNLGSSLSNGT